MTDMAASGLGYLPIVPRLDTVLDVRRDKRLARQHRAGLEVPCLQTSVATYRLDKILMISGIPLSFLTTLTV
jgi:hypothetical protein